MAEIISFDDMRRRRGLAPARSTQSGPRITIPHGKQPGDFVRDRRTGIAGAISRISLVDGEGEAALELVLWTARGNIVTRACHVDPVGHYAS